MTLLFSLLLWLLGSFSSAHSTDVVDGLSPYSSAALIVRQLWLEEIVKEAVPCPGRAFDLEDAEACCDVPQAPECMTGARTVWVVRDPFPDEDFYRGHAYTILPDHRIRVHRIGKNLLCGLALDEYCVGTAGEEGQLRMDCKVLLHCEGRVPKELVIGFRGSCGDWDYCEGSYRAVVSQNEVIKERRSGMWVSRLRSRWRKPVVEIIYGEPPEGTSPDQLPDFAKVELGRVTEKRGTPQRETQRGQGIVGVGPYPAALETDTRTLDGVSAGWVGKNKGLAVALQDNGERMAVVRLKADPGVPGAVHKISWVSPDGERFTVYLGEEGLPIRAELGDTVILFENYSGDRVDITVIHRDGNRVVRRGMPVNPDFIRTLQGLAYAGYGMGDPLASLSLLDALRLGAFALGIAGCASAAIVPGFAIACGAVVMERIMDFIASDNEFLMETLLSTEPYDCDPDELESCANAFLDQKGDQGEDLSPSIRDCSLRMISPFGCEEQP